MRAIQYRKSVPRYLLVRSLAGRWPSASTGRLSCIHFGDVDAPPLPGPHWMRIRPRLSGICGSDLKTIRADGSLYFSPFVSSPFVLGHEIVGTVDEVGPGVEGWDGGERVVVEPVLSCRVRGIAAPCGCCAEEHFNNCMNVMRGDLAPGIQTGCCRSTGGGWSDSLLAHPFQIHAVPDTLSDETAVLIEPFSSAVHAVLKADLRQAETVLVIGCGAIGLLTLAALRLLGYRGRVLAVAKYPRQHELALQCGADDVLRAGAALSEQLAELLHCESYRPDLGKPVLTGGADCTFDCVASSSTLEDALRFTRPRGTVVLAGMPGIVRLDLTALWYKELQLIGAYTYGTEDFHGQRLRTFTLAMNLMEGKDDLFRQLVTGRYKLPAYREALRTAMHMRHAGTIKTVFDLRSGSTL